MFVRRFPCFWLLMLGLVGSAQAAASDLLLQQSGGLEGRVLYVLREHFRFEERLLTPDNDRLLVFFSLPDGAPVILTQITLRINDKVILAHSYSGAELISLQRRSTQLLYIGRLPTGEHTIRLDVRVMQGNVRAMTKYVFVKDDNPKFIEFQLAGYDVREMVTTEW